MKLKKLAKRLLELLDGSGQFDRQGDMHRLIARISSQAGHLKDATHHAIEAARCFEQAGDLYYCAIAWGYVGDLQREAGQFEDAKESFSKFQHYATEWGDRNLIQIAKLATAWVSLDIGDLSHANKQITEIEKDIGAAPSTRLRRYLKLQKLSLKRVVDVIAPRSKNSLKWSSLGMPLVKIALRIFSCPTGSVLDRFGRFGKRAVYCCRGT